MVDRYLANYYPKEPIDGEEEEQQMPAFSVKTCKVNESVTQVYTDGETELVVFTAQYCKQKVIKLINSDEDHTAWMDKILMWQANQSAKSDMHKRWAEACWKVMSKVYAAMMEKPEKYRLPVDATPAPTSSPEEQAKPSSSQPTPSKPPTGLFSGAKKESKS